MSSNIFTDYSKIQKKEFSMRKDKKIKVGDRVEVHHTGSFGNRFGIITDITIALDKNDIAGEQGIRVNDLDLELNYVGTIGFQNDDSFGETDNKFWAYFFQVVDVYGHEKDQYDIHKLEITNVPIENN